jgi:hypothetical protein
MSQGGGILNLGDLAKPATVLIEKISEAIGGIFRPYQIRRIAHAEAHAEKIKAVSQIEITELQRRAMFRFFTEEAKKQQNIESITEKALPELSDAASPEKVEDDWIVNFFDKCRLISDEEMQALWARVLAGEANSPGRFSKRTISLLSSLDKSDAELFKDLCSFGWVIGDVVPLVYDVNNKIYNDAGVYFLNLKHLDQIGLVSFADITGYQRTRLPERVTVFYYGQPAQITFPAVTTLYQGPVKGEKRQENSLQTGCVLLSKVGQELAQVCGSAPRPGFRDFVIAKWKAMGLQVDDLAENPEAEPSPQRPATEA